MDKGGGAIVKAIERVAEGVSVCLYEVDGCYEDSIIWVG